MTSNTSDSLHFEELGCVTDAEALFGRIASKPWAVWLDSGGSDRWSVLATEPRATLVTRGRETRVATRTAAWSSGEDPFTLIRRLMPAVQPRCPLPFAGGAIGYCAYDFGHRLNELPGRDARRPGLPDLAFGIYDVALVIDHETGTANLVGPDSGPALRGLRERWKQRLAAAAQPCRDSGGYRVLHPLTPQIGESEYLDSVATIKRYIHDGDCYQVNYAQPFRARIAGDPAALYRDLRAAAAAPFGAYLNLPFAQILSASPERFLKLEARQVETQPIKGTRPRSADPSIDRRNARMLARSAKDRAENLMIVDLLRNDLGKVCRTGSIRVPRLFELKSFYNVHHLVSTVTGTLADGNDAWDLLAACLPGGSITGAPKRRAMEIIDELEILPREIYCGSIGYVSADGTMDTNIAIRSAVHRGGEVTVWGGGGIVADSSPAEEYRESLDKISGFQTLLS
ncbi:MAG TPA: aminodeoxychorismate synthase component I [Arenicellales bacterium]|nr:aminodeoxychorismate synthase component I [Arenicellales bacterium]